jgi:hypothetical protein
LTRSFLRAANRQRRRHASPGRQRGQLVDHAGHFVRRDVRLAQAVVATRIVPIGFAGVAAARLGDLDPRAEPARMIQDARRASDSGRPPRSCTSEPGRADAATIQNAADDRSPGTTSSHAAGLLSTRTDTLELTFEDGCNRTRASARSV